MYGKGKSESIAKLDGTFRIPVTASAPGQSTELQQSIFNAPPSAAATNVEAPKRPADTAMTDGDGAAHGTKRARSDEEQGEEASMGEDSGGEAMEESDSD